MSKIGKISISIPDKVKVALSENSVNVEGPFGKKVLSIDTENFDLKINDEKQLSIQPKKNNQESKRLWGMNRSLLNNAIIGASKGYEKTLELVGVGYRAKLNGNTLDLTLGFSHPIKHQLPENVTAETPSQTEIILKSHNKQLLGQTAAEIRAYRPPEPYKGKGVKYADEQIKRKEAKKAAGAGAWYE